MTVVLCLCLWVVASIPVGMLAGRFLRGRYPQ